MITPTDEQIHSAKTWKQLFEAIGLNPRNDRACKIVRDWVVEHYPDCHLDRYRRTTHIISDSAFAEAVKTSISIREAITKCGLVAAGAAYAVFHRRVMSLGLDTSHFLGQAAARGITGPRRPLSDYLINDGPLILSHKLKLRLISEGIKSHKCEICGTSEWCGKPVPIALDHEDGNPKNNTIENLRILCANCHAQTDTFSGKKLRKSLNKCAICEEHVKKHGRKTCGSHKCSSELSSKLRKDTLEI